MPLFRSKAEDKVRQAGFDPARLPPGQYLTGKWPVLHAGEVPDVDLATWTLEVTGEVEEPLSLSYDGLRQLPATEVTTDIHCVTRWSRFDARFTGVHWRELAALCRPEPTARSAPLPQGGGAAPSGGRVAVRGWGVRRRACSRIRIAFRSWAGSASGLARTTCMRVGRVGRDPEPRRRSSGASLLEPEREGPGR